VKPILIPLLAIACTAGGQTPTPIRVWGFEGMKPIVLRWEGEYSRQHPGVKFTNVWHGAAAVPAGLYDGVADIAVLGREWWPVDNMAFHWVYQYAPFGIEVASASSHAPRPSFTPVVIVNAANPLQSITLAQLDAVFGAQHRRAPSNARTWGDLGLSEEWARRAIVPAGYGEDDALGVFFRKRVLEEDYKPNPESVLMQGPDADRQIAARVAQEPGAIGYTSGDAADLRGIKEIPVAGSDGAVAPDDKNIESNAYPLSRSVSLYLNRKPGERLPSEIEGFARFVLSEQGQAAVSGNEGYLPLSESRRKNALERVTADWTTDATSKEWKQ
jgi:phosphate transport system substrate-binding protein